MCTYRTGRLVGTLGAVALTAAVLQTSVVPVLGVITRQLTASSAAASWVVTANLLAAAAATPLIGRLADLRNKKAVLLGVLVLVLAGSLLGALTTSLPLLIAARVLQGTSFSLYPVGISILRDELPSDRLVRAIAALSAMLGAGGAAGLVVTGLLMGDGASYHRAFWLNVGVVATVLVAASLVVPSRPKRITAPVDWIGGLGLAAGLSAVIVAVTQGSTWGWTGPKTLGSALAGVVVLGLWWVRSGRLPAPLVSTAMLVRRPILRANTATLMAGMGLYFSFLGLTDFVEAPVAGGYGFGATVLGASVGFLLPGALAAALAATVGGRCIERFGARAVVTAGAVLGVLGFAMLTGWHSARWEVIIAGLLTNAYTSLAYVALPALIVREVEPGDTGVATGLNGIVRTVGSAAAAAVVGTLLNTSGRGMVPEGAFAALFILGAVTAAAVILLVAWTPTAGANPARLKAHA